MSEIEPRFWMFDDGEYGVELYKERSQPDMAPLYDESALAKARAEERERCERELKDMASRLKAVPGYSAQGGRCALLDAVDRIRALSERTER